jgi:hypothetical protein
VGRILCPLLSRYTIHSVMNRSRLLHRHICESHVEITNCKNVLSRYPGFSNVPHLVTGGKRYSNMCPIKCTNAIFHVWICSSIISYSPMNCVRIGIFWNNEIFCYCHHTILKLTKFSTNGFTGVIKTVLGFPIGLILRTNEQENC